MKGILPIRELDDHGSGLWDAPRGKRRHKGIDLAAYPNTKILAIKAGMVTKLGFAYPDDLSWRYVRVEDVTGLYWDYFYVLPMVNVGDKVEADEAIGSLQDLRTRYKGITPHCHLRVMRNGMKINPETVI